MAASTSVGERIGVLDARIAEQARRVADVELQGREIADAVAKMTSTGKAKFAIAASEAQQKRRDGQEAADRHVELQGRPRARLDAENQRVTAQTGPPSFLAAQLGTDAESVIRWLVALLVMLIDPPGSGADNGHGAALDYRSDHAVGPRFGKRAPNRNEPHNGYRSNHNA